LLRQAGAPAPWEGWQRTRTRAELDLFDREPRPKRQVAFGMDWVLSG